MKRWLSLKVADPSSTGISRVLIAIPKRTVKLAVARNRLRRVLREAVRIDPFFKKAGTYRLMVHEMPQDLDLKAAQRILETLHD